MGSDTRSVGAALIAAFKVGARAIIGQHADEPPADLDTTLNKLDNAATKLLSAAMTNHSGDMPETMEDAMRRLAERMR